MKRENRKTKHGKAFCTIGIVLLALIVVYAAFAAVSVPLLYGAFHRNAEKVATIPNLLKGFIPQGVTRAEGNDLCLICGYRTDDKPSRIYRIGADGKATEILLEREDGSAYGGHAGGMSLWGDYVYVSNASKIFVLDAEAVRNAEDGGTVRFLGHFDVPCRASFCSTDGKMLYVGEYHADGYETDETHAVETDSGLYQATVFGYELDASSPYGVRTPERPAVVYAIPDYVQGFAVSDAGTAALSCSHGLADSLLRYYDVSDAVDRTFAYNGEDLPLYILDSRRAEGSMAMPHMSEDLEYVGGRLYTLFEAGALKYGGSLLPATVRNIVALYP